MQLAEFFLKRLNHQDPAAVELGYHFYARTQEENLSLSRMLQELLTDCKMGEKRTAADRKMVKQELNPRLDAVLPNRQGESRPETDSMRNDLSFLYGQVQEGGPENVFGGERAKRQDKREAKREAKEKQSQKNLRM